MTIKKGSRKHRVTRVVKEPVFTFKFSMVELHNLQLDLSHMETLNHTTTDDFKRAVSNLIESTLR